MQQSNSLAPWQTLPNMLHFMNLKIIPWVSVLCNFNYWYLANSYTQLVVWGDLICLLLITSCIPNEAFLCFPFHPSPNVSFYNMSMPLCLVVSINFLTPADLSDSSGYWGYQTNKKGWKIKRKMLTLRSGAGFCKRFYFNSLNNLEYNMKDFL